MNFNFYHTPVAEQIHEEVKTNGYSICHDMIDPAVYAGIKEFWLDYFKKVPAVSYVVRGHFLLGEPNFSGYEDTAYYGCLYRHFDFLWNEPAHELTRKLAIDLFRFKNAVVGLPLERGLNYNPQMQGAYVATSYYPSGSGKLKVHRDTSHEFDPLIHYMMPITFKGIDYESGGLCCVDEQDNVHDIDAKMKPGSVIFFNAKMRHFVKEIQSSKGVGRLAVFGQDFNFHKPDTLSAHVKNRFNRWVRGNSLVLNTYGSYLARKQKKEMRVDALKE